VTEPPRWLDAAGVAAYICVRVDLLARLVREGRIPEPNYELGKRKPRWDRLAIDAKFEGLPQPPDAAELAKDIVAEILAKGGRRTRTT
jgi:hypothetical protein